MSPTSPPCALDRWDELAARVRERPAAVYLDYDGTLAPIARRPELAVLPQETRRVLGRLAQRAPVAIVTGRGLDDIRRRVDLPRLYYAANHGFEITGPDVTHEVDPAMFATMTEVAQELRPCVDAIDGAIMEAKGYSIAVHYRLVDPARVAGLHEEISRVVREHATVRLSSGKKVLEIRPTRDWHKGRALRWLHDRVLGDGGRRIPLFAGDDLTDEDALREVAGDGIGIFVGTPTWHTAARYSVSDPTRLRALLARLATVA